MRYRATQTSAICSTKPTMAGKATTLAPKGPREYDPGPDSPQDSLPAAPLTPPSAAFRFASSASTRDSMTTQ